MWASCILRLLWSTFNIIQGTFGIIQGTFGIIQGTFSIIQRSFGIIQGTFFKRLLQLGWMHPQTSASTQPKRSVSVP
jgi:hypothetical protein